MNTPEAPSPDPAARARRRAEICAAFREAADRPLRDGARRVELPCGVIEHFDEPRPGVVRARRRRS